MGDQDRRLLTSCLDQHVQPCGERAGVQAGGGLGLAENATLARELLDRTRFATSTPAGTALFD